MVDAFIRARRGTDAERLTVVFREGELVYVTDQKVMWIGDGVTPGGIRVGSVGPGSVAWADITGKPTTFAPIIGPGAADACAGNDPRLSDARTPVVHNQGLSTITTAITAGTLVKSDGSNPVAASVTEGDVIANNAKVSFPGFGTTGTTACVGNDSRLSDARTPTAHTQGLSTITTAITAGTLLKSDGSNPVASSVTEADVTANNAKVSFPGFGATGSTACVGNDGRLSDARTPTAHEATHEANGSDPLPWGTIHGRGTTASKPAAASTNVGYLYYDTTLSQLQRSNGTTWDVLTASGGTPGGTTGQVQYNNGGAFGGVAEGTSGQVLTSGGPGVAPSFTTISGGSGSGGGGWGKSGMLGLSANQITGLTANSPVLFDTATGDFTVSGGSVVIKGGSKAELVFGANIGSTTTAGIDFQWYNVTTSAWEGIIGTFLPTTYASNGSTSNTCVAIVNPASDTTYQVRIKTASGLQAIYAGYTWAKISATTPTGGAWAKSSQLLLASGQTTNLDLNDPVKFATVNGDHLLSNYAVTVKGGSVATLRGNASGATAGASSYGALQWYDMTANSYIGNVTEFLPLSLSGSSVPGGGATARVSPVNDTQYQLRINYLTGAGAITAIQNANATVESTDPMWPTAGGWAKSSLLKLSTNQTTNLTSGSVIRFDIVEGDHTLSNYKVMVKGGSTAKLTASLALGGVTEWAVWKWYNSATGVAVGVGSNAASVTANPNPSKSVQSIATARVSPSTDTEYELRFETNYLNQTTSIGTDSWATVESTDPNPPKGGNWALSSLVTLSANQTSNLAVGQPIRFDTISGDHTLQNYRVKVKGGQKAELIGNCLCVFNSSSDWANIRWYNIVTSAYVGRSASMIPVTYSLHQSAMSTAVALETPLVDTEYELRIEAQSGTITNFTAGSYAQVHSTLPNASVTSQVIKRESVATAVQNWTVTLPVACKALRITLVLVNGTASSNSISLGVNGVSTGHRQFLFASNGTTVSAQEEPNTTMGAIRASGALDRDFTLKIADGETRYNVVGGDFTAADSLSTFTQYMRIAQNTDISSITFSGTQAGGIGAGSYIIVERVDAEISQDLGWQDYTPTCYIDLTSATTVPNITPSVRYRVQGKTLFMQGTLNFTGAPTGATDLSISLPTGVNVVSLPAASKFTIAGNSAFYDSSVGVTGVWKGGIRLPLSPENTGRVSFRAQTAISTIAGVAPTVPFTWANGNQLEFDFFTEIQ